MSQKAAVERKILKLMANNTVMHLETIFYFHNQQGYSLEITARKKKKKNVFINSNLNMKE